jgi:hypothetical protein
MGKTKNEAVTRLTFFHPDFTVGPGVTPDPVVQGTLSLAPLVGSTTDRELLSRIHNVFDYSPCPEGCQASAI